MSSPRPSPTRRRPYAARMPLGQRREQLLDAALALIVRDGYGAVSIDAVATEAGVSRPVVYGAFDDLTTLLETLLDRQEERAMGQVLDVLLDHGVDRGAGDVARELAVRVLADPMTWRPILATSSVAPRAVRVRIGADRERVRRRVTVMMRGRLGPDGGGLDPEILGHALLGMAENIGRVLLEEPASVDVDRLAATVDAVFAAVHDRARS
ncbi:MAG: TetR/AcrR family transcriptional regulator [Marmoricola sp.]